MSLAGPYDDLVEGDPCPGCARELILCDCGQDPDEPEHVICPGCGDDPDMCVCS